MSLVRLEGVVREIGTFVILDHIDAAIAVGERVGLVGPNGAGKTTLLRIVSGRDEADRGTVTRRRHLSLGLLSQEAHFDEAFMAAPDLRAAVRHGAAHLETMAVELEQLEHGGHAGGNRYADLQHRFDVLGGYTLDQRVDEALSGLGFARDEWLRPPTALSGGQQTRAALARLVVANPDLLMLDEPTNHLDINAIEWLEEHLRRRSGALLVASHDRAFLDATVTRIWELRDRRLTVFRGDYTAYHRQRVERDLRAEKEAESQSDAIEREVELVQRYRSQRKHVKMHEHEARLEKLKADRIEAPRKSSRTLRLHGQSLAGGPVRSGELVVRMEDLAVGYLPGRGALKPDGSEAPEPVTVATAPFLAAQRGERIGIVGPNGAGKTTLLRTIAGDLPPLDGMIVFGHQVQPGYLAQLRDAAIPGRHGPGRDHGGDAGHARRGARLPRPVPVPRRRRVQGGPGALGRRAVAPRARAARDHAVEPAAPRRADEPPGHRGARGDRGVLRRDARDAAASSRTTAGCWRRSASGCGWSTTGWRCRSTAATGPGARRWRTAGPWPPRRAGARTGSGRGHRAMPAAPGGGPGPRRSQGCRDGDGGRPRARGSPRARRPSATRPATPPPTGRSGARSCPRRPTGAAARRSTRSCRASACARASWSWRWARRRSRPTSSRCAA